MSLLGQKTKELVNSYDSSLEQRLVDGGSSLACKDEELWKHVEELLREGAAQNMHALGLDPLKVMEESLKAAAASRAVSGGQVRYSGGLKGLAKAFEVLEQAAVNLYLGPWREEYKVVKMYSGIFTHYIKPVLSMPQILKLFGLLGYQSCSSCHDQLQRQSSSVSSSSLGNLLHLSCAFFLARCECLVLLSALGKHAGDTEWELSIVRERLRGHSIQEALGNTKKMLAVNQPMKDHLEVSGIDGDLDLYTAEEGNSRQKEMGGDDGESPQSLSWVTNSSNLLPAVVTHSNGVPSCSSSFTSPSRDPVCVSTLNYQLAKVSPLGLVTIKDFSATSNQAGDPYEEPTNPGFDRDDFDLHSLSAQALSKMKPSEVKHICSCVESNNPYLKQCGNCDTCYSHQDCQKMSRCGEVRNKTAEEVKQIGAVSSQRPSLNEGDVSGSPTHMRGNMALPSFVLRECQDSVSQTPEPIPYHVCCDPAHLDPQFTCLTCRVFHSGCCKEIKCCQKFHSIQPLGVCQCGRVCTRKPLVLCRYCGKEYCNLCWYRNPVECACGQTFDQSSSV
ncbi:spermatogenesis associated 2-like [Lampris incognitus]|uniref:spermatogenesis associated 2-like n=1 Tax=Lampris incognitus TaxID=2546036 RepID=UPI0024B59F8F|nr:spermatogenesis associated 2-like [Lampris incognitus]